MVLLCLSLGLKLYAIFPIELINIINLITNEFGIKQTNRYFYQYFSQLQMLINFQTHFQHYPLIQITQLFINLLNQNLSLICFIYMIRSQQSEDDHEGFFKPKEKVQQFKNNHLNQLETNKNQQQANQLVEHARPNDFQARIIRNFQVLNPYPEYLMGNKCQPSVEQMVSLAKNSEKVSKKYLTLEEKYQNNEKYELTYSKLSNPKDFSSYIFSLQGLTDYNDNNYIKDNGSPDKNGEKMSEETNGQNDMINSEFQFDSNFQSGNLLYCFRDRDQEQMPTFDLIIQNDTNTKGYNQWFYFSVQKLYRAISQKITQKLKTQKTTIKINIVNFIKKHLMFEDGVRPVGYFESEGEWRFIGRQTQYKKSYIKRYIQYNGSNVTKNYYTLSFLLDFPSSSQSLKQKVYIALNYPYPYKRAVSFIDQFISQNSSKEIQIQKLTLCHTISNNQVPYIVINSKPTQKQIQQHIKFKRIRKQKQKEKNLAKKEFLEDQISAIIEQNQNEDAEFNQVAIKNQILDNKKKILLLARQHPGQTVGSFVLQGFLKHLMKQLPNNQVNEQSNSERSQSPLKSQALVQCRSKLLKQYSIYVFPMINVDGVIYGNFRTNLTGFDLNRQWINPNKWLHPQIYHLKKFVSSLKNIQSVLDFHGHSRKLNSFIYACNNPVPNLIQNQDQSNYPNISMFRLYPYIFSKQCELFSIKDCTYTISRDKVKTARINTFKSLNYNPYVFTLETGFFGYVKDDKKYRYKIDDFFEIGRGALQSLKTVLLKPKKTKQILKEVQNKSYLFDMWSFENKQDPGSQSNPSQDQLNPVQIKTKVLSDERLKQKQLRQAQKRNGELNEKKIKIKKPKKKKQQRKAQTELKSQRSILHGESQQIKILFRKTSSNNQNERSIKKQANDFKTKSSKIQYLNERKKNNMNNPTLFNIVAVKEAVVQKPEFKLPEPNYRQRNVKVFKKPLQEDFKSTSNLLGTGFSYFQNKSKNFFDQAIKGNPATLQMLEVNNLRRDTRIQSFVSDPSYENIAQKVNKSIVGEPRIKDLFSNYGTVKDKSPLSKALNREKIYVVRENKIVKVVNNVSKNRTYSQKSILETELNQRQKNLIKCQEIMCAGNRNLMEEIKDQINEEKKGKKKVYLNPIQY